MKYVYTDGTQMTAQDRRSYLYLTLTALVLILLLTMGVVAVCLTGGGWLALGLSGFVVVGYVFARGVAAISDGIPTRNSEEERRSGNTEVLHM